MKSSHVPASSNNIQRRRCFAMLLPHTVQFFKIESSPCSPNFWEQRRGNGNCDTSVMKENGVRLTQMKIKRGEIITTEKEGTKDLGKKKKKKKISRKMPFQILDKNKPLSVKYGYYISNVKKKLHCFKEILRHDSDLFYMSEN